MFGACNEIKVKKYAICLSFVVHVVQYIKPSYIDSHWICNLYLFFETMSPTVVSLGA